MKNVEKAERIHLGSLIEDLKNGQFVIPDFQRDFEWQPRDVLDLVKSIFMDYYIGTLLLWKGSKENYNLLSCDSIYAYIGKSDPRHIVLDGQQRLTSIYYAFFQPNVIYPNKSKPVVFFLDIQEYLDENYENAFDYEYLNKKTSELISNKDLQFEKHIFPLGVMKDGTWGTGDWIKEYKEYWLNKAESEIGDSEDSLNRKNKYTKYTKDAVSFKNIIEELFNKYFVSYIELDRDVDVAKVCDIFTKINSRGITLDIFDLLNAILRPKDIQLKNMWLDIKEDLNYTDLKKMKIYVLQVMSILEQSYCSAKYLYYLVPDAVKNIKKNDGSLEKVILVKDKDDFMLRWENSVSALKKAIKSLRNPRDFGAIKPDFVPYPSIIPVFSAIKNFVENENFPNKLDIQTKIRKWYWSSVFTKRYSSSVESTSAKDFQDLKKWFINDDDELEVVSEFIGRYRSIDLLNDNLKGSAIYNAIFNLFVINEARDWSTFDLPEYETLDDHHIVPLSIFGKEAGASINSILNRTPLSSITNRHIIKDRMPNNYIKEMLTNNNEDKVYDVFASHLISRKAVSILLRDPFSKTDFEEFLLERQDCIRDAIESMLIREKLDIPVALQTLNKNIEKIELQLRDLIISKIGNSNENYKSSTPGHIQEKVDKRINIELKKNPALSLDDYSEFAKKLKYFDMSEYFDFIVSKQNWSIFGEMFATKEQLQNRFNQLSSLRNCIRHSRDISNIERLDGEAAIEWFNQSLKKK